MGSKPDLSMRKEPVQSRSRQLVEDVVEAAARILEGPGYDRATTNRIADKAGVSVGSLYRFFPNKQSIIARLMRRFISGNLATFEQRLHDMEGETFEAFIAGAVELVVERFFDHGKLVRALHNTLPGVYQAQVIVAIRREYARIIAEFFEPYADEIGRPDLEVATNVITNALMGVIHWSLLDEEAPDREVIAEECSAMIYAYMVYGADRRPAT